MATVLCPECGQDLRVPDSFDEGDHLVCSRCRTKLEIIGVEPLEIDWVYNEPFELWQEMATQ